MTILHYPLYWLGWFLYTFALIAGAMLAGSLGRQEIEIRKERE